MEIVDELTNLRGLNSIHSQKYSLSCILNTLLTLPMGDLNFHRERLHQQALLPMLPYERRYIARSGLVRLK